MADVIEFPSKPAQPSRPDPRSELECRIDAIAVIVNMAWQALLLDEDHDPAHVGSALRLAGDQLQGLREAIGELKIR